MDKLYNITLKMLKDKHNLDEYPRDKFNLIYYQVFNSNNNNLEINDLNKLILKRINESIIINENENEMEKKINELKNIRNNMNINANVNLNANNIKNFENDNDNDYDYDNNFDITDKISEIQDIRSKMNNNNNNIKSKTFIINSIKTDFITKINKNNISPVYLCLPNFIKNITPCILLSISDSYNNNNIFKFIIDKKSGNWDIWKPVIDNYNKINLENTNWNIKLYDFNNYIISMNDYYSTVIEILEINNNYEIKVNKIQLFNLNDRIKIIFFNNTSIDNIINKINYELNIIQISKNDININDFINSKIFNYNFQISLIFKYY